MTNKSHSSVEVPCYNHNASDESHHRFEHEYNSESPHETGTNSSSVNLSSLISSESSSGDTSDTEEDLSRDIGYEEFWAELLAASDQPDEEYSEAHVSNRKERRSCRRRESSTFKDSVFWSYTSKGLRNFHNRRHEPLTKKWFFWDCNRGSVNHTGRAPRISQQITDLATAARVAERHRAFGAKPYRTYYLLEHSIHPNFEENRNGGVLSWNSRASDLNASKLDKIWDNTMMYVLKKADYSSSSHICNILGALMDRRSDRVFIDLWVDARTDNRRVGEIRRQWASEIGVSSSSFRFDSMEEYIHEERKSVYVFPGTSRYNRRTTNRHHRRENLKFPVYRGRRNPGEESPEP